MDCIEEFVTHTIIMRSYFALCGHRFSEREEGKTKSKVQMKAKSLSSRSKTE